MSVDESKTGEIIYQQSLPNFSNFPLTEDGVLHDDFEEEKPVTKPGLKLNLHQINAALKQIQFDPETGTWVYNLDESILDPEIDFLEKQKSIFRAEALSYIRGLILNILAFEYPPDEAQLSKRNPYSSNSRFEDIKTDIYAGYALMKDKYGPGLLDRIFIEDEAYRDWILCAWWNRQSKIVVPNGMMINSQPYSYDVLKQLLLQDTNPIILQEVDLWINFRKSLENKTHALFDAEKGIVNPRASVNLEWQGSKFSIPVSPTFFYSDDDRSSTILNISSRELDKPHSLRRALTILAESVAATYALRNKKRAVSYIDLSNDAMSIDAIYALVQTNHITARFENGEFLARTHTLEHDPNNDAAVNQAYEQAKNILADARIALELLGTNFHEIKKFRRKKQAPIYTF